MALFSNEHEALLFFQYRNSQQDNIRFTMEKKLIGLWLFLMLALTTKIPLCHITSVYHKKISTGLLTNFFSSFPFLTNLALIRTLLDRAYKINNTLLAFNEDVEKLSYILKRNHPLKIQ